jgi:hypothetical protein
MRKRKVEMIEDPSVKFPGAIMHCIIIYGPSGAWVESWGVHECYWFNSGKKDYRKSDGRKFEYL